MSKVNPEPRTLPLSIATLLVAAVVVVLTRWIMFTALDDRLERRGEMLVRELSPVVAEAMVGERYAFLQDYLDRQWIGGNDIGYLRIKNRYGLVVARQSVLEAGAMDADLRPVTVAVPNGLGTIHLGISAVENQWVLRLVTVALTLGSLAMVRRRSPVSVSPGAVSRACAEENGSADRSAGEPAEIPGLNEKFRRQTRWLQHVFDTITHPFFVIDISSFHIVMANDAFRELYPGEASTCHELIHRKMLPMDGGADWCCPILEVKKKKRPVVVEQVHVDARGEQKFLELCARPIMNRRGELAQVAVYGLDITDRKKAQDAVEDALARTRDMALQQEMQNALMQKQKKRLEKAYGDLKMAQSQMLQKEKMASIGQLAAGVAHEINNPMGFISSNLVSLGKHTQRLVDFIEAQTELYSTLPGAETVLSAAAKKRKELRVDYVLGDLKDLLAESLEGAERVKAIVQNLKSFSRIDAAEESRINIHDCLESTINIVWNEIKYKAELKREYGDLPMINCFPQQLNQVFMNLLVNAAHAIEKNGEIVVRTWRQGENVMITVADNGSGIAPEHLNRLFEPFFTTKEVGKGTGLGLSIAYDIVKKHKGEIRVASEVGKGTTFAISLPITEND